jgi:hypothetical protein
MGGGELGISRYRKEYILEVFKNKVVNKTFGGYKRYSISVKWVKRSTTFLLQIYKRM